MSELKRHVGLFHLTILSFVNFIGIRESVWLNTIFAIVTALGLVLIIYLGFSSPPASEIDYFESPLGMSGIIIAFVLVFFAFIGFEDMAKLQKK